MGSLGPELMPDSDGVPPSNRQRPDVLSNHSLPLVLASCGEPSIIRYSILVSRSSFSIPRLPVSRFSFLVFSSSFSVTCLPVSHSSFLVLSSIPRRCCRSRFIRFSRLLAFRRLAPSLSLLRSSLPRRLDVHLLLMSRMGSGRVGTHAGFRWCASSIGSVSTVLLLVVRSSHSLFLLVSDSSLVGAGDDFFIDGWDYAGVSP
jgi:hypothetical protein